MNKVSFGSYNPNTYRTMQKRAADLGKIDEKIQEYSKKNAAIQQTIESLKEQLTSKIQSFQNVKGMDAKSMQADINAINKKINELEAEMQTNKNLITGLWYGYHERL